MTILNSQEEKSKEEKKRSKSIKKGAEIKTSTEKLKFGNGERRKEKDGVKWNFLEYKDFVFALII